jgi:hypothetical protein
LEFADLGLGLVIADKFFDEPVGGGSGGDLGQMGDAQKLVVGAKGGKFFSDTGGGLATDADINFVKNEGGNFVGGGENAFDGEHDAGDFAATGDFAQGLGGITGIDGDEELDIVRSMGTKALS